MLETSNYAGELLVAEKESNIVKMLKANIEKHGNIVVRIIEKDVLTIAENFDLIFCDVLGHYLTDQEFQTNFPKMLQRLNRMGLAFISDMNEVVEVKNKLTRTSHLLGELHEYEEDFKRWIYRHLDIELTDQDVLQIRTRLFQTNVAHKLRNNLLDKYRILLPSLNLVRSVAITSEAYVENGNQNVKVSRCFDYMLFKNNN